MKTKEIRNPEYMRIWKRNNPDRVKYHKRKDKLKKKYGITPEQYDTLLVQQNGLCASCHIAPTDKQLAVDHCHVTGRIRGLLYTNCNLILGLAQDNPNTLKSLIEYLKC